MADLKAKRVSGSNYTADDILELQFTYTGAASTCVQHIELISGVDVTHSGAPATTPLHYKSVENDADGDGVIDYSSSFMNISQTEKGTSVVKVCATVILQSEEDAWKVEYEAWKDENFTDVTLEDGTVVEVYSGDSGDSEENAVVPDPPTAPTGTIYKSGEITLQWSDDSFV